MLTFESPFNFTDCLPTACLQPKIPTELSFMYTFPIRKYENSDGRYTRRIDIITTDNEAFNVTAYGDSGGIDKLFTIREITQPAEQCMCIYGGHEPFNVAFEIESNYDIYEMLIMAMVYNELLGGELINMTHPAKAKGRIIFHMFPVEDGGYECKDIVNYQILNLAVMLVTIIQYNPKDMADLRGYAYKLHHTADIIAMDVTEAALQYWHLIAHFLDQTEAFSSSFSRGGIYEYKNRKYNTYMDWDEWMYKE